MTAPRDKPDAGWTDRQSGFGVIVAVLLTLMAWAGLLLWLVL